MVLIANKGIDPIAFLPTEKNERTIFQFFFKAYDLNILVLISNISTPIDLQQC